MGGKGGRIFRNSYKGHMDKTKRGGDQGGEGGMAGVGGGVVREKCRQLYLNNSKKITKRKKNKTNKHILR